MPQKVGSTASSLAQAKELASKCGIKLQREIRLPNVGLSWFILDEAKGQ